MEEEYHGTFDLWEQANSEGDHLRKELQSKSNQLNAKNQENQDLLDQLIQSKSKLDQVSQSLMEARAEFDRSKIQYKITAQQLLEALDDTHRLADENQLKSDLINRMSNEASRLNSHIAELRANEKTHLENLRRVELEFEVRY